jgi:acetyl-CoA synthetase
MQTVGFGEKRFVCQCWIIGGNKTGGIMIANYHAGTNPQYGKPFGVEAAIAVYRNEIKLLRAQKQGHLVLRKGWPSMFRSYLHEEQRYQKCFRGDWYITGDLAKKDADGYYWFVGRADDIIKTSGHMVGPFEVESVLMEHPAVAEAAVIGKPDPMIGELVKAFAVLKTGSAANEETKMDIIAYARKKLGAAVAPKEIAFVEGLPKTKSGKILRRLLKARELGLPEGDLSTLEQS